MPIRYSTRLARILLPLYELVYPPVCPACAEHRRDGAAMVCRECNAALIPLGMDDPVLLLAAARLHQERACHSVTARYALTEGSVVQTLVHRLKYDGAEHLGVRLGRVTASTLMQHSGGIRLDGLVPVPLHAVRRRERGYNQAEAIARGLSAETGIPVRPLLRRRVNTPSQTRLSASDRAVNVRGAFAVPRQYVPAMHGKRYVLVDDVVTTGATVAEAARTLRAAGALAPLVCAVALAG